MDDSKYNDLDSILSASLHINIEQEAAAFMSRDVSQIEDDPKLKRAIMRSIYRTPPRARKPVFRTVVAASIVAAILLLSACICIPKIRESIWNTIVEWYDDYIAIHFSYNADADTGENSDSLTSSEQIVPPASIESQAYASYLPAGYYAKDHKSSSLYRDTFYYDKTNTMQFRLVQTTHGEALNNDMMVDMDNDCITNTSINGNDGILVEYIDIPGLYYLVWQDDLYQYSLYGSFTSVSELMKIAEGIMIE